MCRALHITFQSQSVCLCAELKICGRIRLFQVWLLTLFVLMERETASQRGIATPFKQEAATLVRAEDFCFRF